MPALTPNVGIYAIGDIVLAEFSGDGHEQDGTRPAIVVGKVAALNMATVVPLTKSIESKRFPLTVTIKKHTVNGLDQDSVALVFQVTVMDGRFIKRKFGCLNPTELAEVKTLLKAHFLLT